jgi:hypothetical protein
MCCGHCGSTLARPWRMRVQQPLPKQQTCEHAPAASGPALMAAAAARARRREARVHARPRAGLRGRALRLLPLFAREAARHAGAGAPRMLRAPAQAACMHKPRRRRSAVHAPSAFPERPACTSHAGAGPPRMLRAPAPLPCMRTALAPLPHCRLHPNPVTSLNYLPAHFPCTLASLLSAS